jgi:hypothetical protein
MSVSNDFPGIAPDLPQTQEGASEPDRARDGRFAGDGKAGGRPSKGRREKHGIGALRKLVVEAVARVESDTPFDPGEIDGRTRVGKALRALRRELIEEQGGLDVVTPQMQLLIDLVCTDQLIVGSLDAILTHLCLTGEIVDEDKNGRLSLAPIVRDRAYLADSMARRLAELGLKPTKKPAASLEEELEAMAKRKGRSSPPDEGAPPPANAG